MVATNLIGVCEFILYAYKSGLDVAKTFDMISQGTAASYQLKVNGPKIMKRDFGAGFYAEHFYKDLGLALSECEKI